jgi:hypothetical protein
MSLPEFLKPHLDFDLSVDNLWTWLLLCLLHLRYAERVSAVTQQISGAPVLRDRGFGSLEKVARLHPTLRSADRALRPPVGYINTREMLPKSFLKAQKLSGNSHSLSSACWA